MLDPAEEHYCKHCKSFFSIKLARDVSGDFFLECPVCSHQHYRHFNKGQAIHCDIGKRHADPKVVRGIEGRGFSVSSVHAVSMRR